MDGLFRFSKTESESIRINPFLKIIIFYYENIHICKKGDFYLWGASLRAEKITKQTIKYYFGIKNKIFNY